MAKLFDFQENSVKQLLSGKHFIISGTGSGKTAMALVWADKKVDETGKDKLLVVTTASKSKTGDFENEADVWAPNLKQKLKLFSVISWHKLNKWLDENWKDVSNHIVIYDEVQKGAAGVSSKTCTTNQLVNISTHSYASFNFQFDTVFSNSGNNRSFDNFRINAHLYCFQNVTTCQVNSAATFKVQINARAMRISP